jgi:hypothetical protein
LDEIKVKASQFCGAFLCSALLYNLPKNGEAKMFGICLQIINTKQRACAK